MYVYEVYGMSNKYEILFEHKTTGEVTTELWD